MQKKKKIDFSAIFFSLVALVLAGISWKEGGSGLVLAGISSGAVSLLQVIPLLIAAFLTAGLIQVLISKDMVEKWLGAKSGWRGLFIACIGGALIPGGPYVYYPITGALLHSGAGIGVLVAFITAKNLWSISRIPMELALLGSKLTINRYVITFAIPLLLGFFADLFFGRFITKIRKDVEK